MTAVTAIHSADLLKKLMEIQSFSAFVWPINAESFPFDRAIFCFVGMIFGITYGLDGWNVFKPAAEFKDSRRVKGLRYATGGLIAAIFGDLRMVGIQGNRIPLLAFYVGGFVCAAILTIFFVAVGLAIRFHLMRKRDPENYPPEPFTPVWDYVHWGYDKFRQGFEASLEKLRERSDEKGKIHLKDFLPIYSTQVTKVAVAGVEGFHKNPSAESKKALITEVLRSAVTTVQVYRQMKDGILNANCMVLYTRDTLPQRYMDKVRFHSNDVGRFRYFLAIEHWAEEEGSVDFVLPVEDLDDPQNADRSLPGAPLALIKKSLQVVDDTRNVKFPPRIRQDTKNEQSLYFENAEFRSFACVNIPGQLGIVVVQSKEKNIFGNSKKEKQQTADLLRPFCAALKTALAVKTPKTGGEANA